MSSEALSRTLKIFKDQGDIELKGQRIIILLDRENLEEILKN
jgi:CRP-like cAMP-binding protein